VTNRGPEAAPVCVLPTLWFRNTWSWGRDPRRPTIFAGTAASCASASVRTLLPRHYALGDHILYCADTDGLLFTENETNSPRLFQSAAPTPWVKDAFHEFIVDGKREAVNPAQSGTK